MKKSRVIGVALAGMLVAGCGGSYNDKTEPVMQDNLSLYDQRDNPTLNSMAISIPTPNDLWCSPYTNPAAPPRPCTLEDVLNDVDPYDDYKPALHVALMAQSNVSYAGTGVMTQKGKSSRRAKQKSFRIKMDSTENLYKGQRVFQLGKHPYDRSRVKNKLFFDLFAGIPHFNSLRTEFFNLTIDGVPYGLYTHTEKVDEFYLISRGMAPDGNIYKAQDFDFRYDAAFALDADGRPLYPDLFDLYLEIENGKNHKTLVEMLQAVNSASLGEFMKVFNRYFDYDNYVTWMAINFVVANRDTINQNFYLYNPKNSSKFYFIPWDYDGAVRVADYPKWQFGFGLYWGIPLHRGFLSFPENRAAVRQKMQEIYDRYINPTTVGARLALYRPIVEPMISSAPDSEHLSYTRWSEEFNALPGRILGDMIAFDNEAGSPMPYWEGVVATSPTLVISWGKSVDFEGDPLVYEVAVSRSPDMSNPLYYQVFDETALTLDGNDYVLDTGLSLSPGLYFFKVVAKEKNNPAHYQIAFDTYRGDQKYFGVHDFIVP